MPISKDVRKVTTHVHQEVHELLQEEARRQSRSVSNLLLVMLRDKLIDMRQSGNLALPDEDRLIELFRHRDSKG